MTNSMAPQEWLHFIRDEYLRDFVGVGGSSIKFVVPLDDKAEQTIKSGLLDMGDECRFLILEVDAADTKIHMIDQLFFRLAEQLPWDILAERVVIACARECGYEIPEPLGDKAFEDLATANSFESNLVLNEMKRRLTEKVYKNRDLAKDFRIAMMQLCLARLIGGEEGARTRQIITDWITGVTKSVTPVKPFQIFNRINRANARHLMESMFRWVKLCGHPGVLIILDSCRLSTPKRPGDGTVFYTKAAMLDAYEVFRQFIDATDRLSSALLAIIAAPDFLDEDQSGRGMGVYEALKFRIYDEVRDRRLVNPMGSLVRLSSTEEGQDRP